MLLELQIENYAVVDKLHIHFGEGLNVLTGETGSGKSIVVDALDLLFGGRSSAEMVRTGAKRARISGIFEVSSGAQAHLKEAEIENEEADLLVEREILDSGKSRAWIASRPVTAAVLRNLAPHLGDIHGQHDQQQLFTPESQLAVLDEFGATASTLSAVREIYREWRSCTDELKQITELESDRLRLLDMWTFQRTEIESARLKPGEDDELEADRRILQNVGRLMENATAAYEALYDAPGSASSQVRLSAKRLEDLTKIDASQQSLLDLLKPAQIAIEEASSQLRDYLGKLEADPNRLEDVESRLANLEKLKRKYGTTVEEILAFLHDVSSKIEGAESTAERREEIERRQAKLSSDYDAAAADLTRTRTAAAEELAQRVEKELASLGMERTRFRIVLSDGPRTARGTDIVAFLVSPNLGEEPKPLDRIASGGELSRIALALKTCSTESGRSRRTLVFDEVDAGIGGAAAERVGQKLKALAASNQVLCVTHLAQIAGYGDKHFVVRKDEVGGRTAAAVNEISGAARTREVGRMLSGQHLTPEALKHAEQLIRSGS